MLSLSPLPLLLLDEANRIRRKRKKQKTKFTKKLQRGKKFCESAESQHNKKESKKELHFTANLVAAAGNQGARAALVDKQKWERAGDAMSLT